MKHPANGDALVPLIFDATVISNALICREHYLLVLAGVNITGAQPGQFLHLAPAHSPCHSSSPPVNRWSMGTSWSPVPMLRRAFSIAGLRQRSADECEMDTIYRVVGTATRWMCSLRARDTVSVMGPLGNSFPIKASKHHAWMVGGGVGLPPMLWLAEALCQAGRERIAFLGVQSADLLPLTITDAADVAVDARASSLAAKEFAAFGTPVVISTDDGTLGFGGYVGSALRAYFSTACVSSSDLVIYACGPEAMMQDVARFCLDASIECYVCMERAMACGTGTCQSCVVPVREETAAQGWRYELCCTQGPVFDAKRVIWTGDTGGGDQH